MKRVKECAEMVTRDEGYRGSDLWFVWMGRLEVALLTLAKVEYLTESF